jgi:hypothetical protein
MSVNQSKLKESLKAAFAEVLDEHREFVKEVVKEAFEDIGHANAIDEGMTSKMTSRDDVMKVFADPV